MKFLKIKAIEDKIQSSKGTEVFKNSVIASVAYVSKIEKQEDEAIEPNDVWMARWMDHHLDTAIVAHTYCCDDESAEQIDGKWFLKEDTELKKVTVHFLNADGEALSAD